MATYSSNTTIKFVSAIDATSYSVPAGHFAIVTFVIPSAGGTVTITSSSVDTATFQANSSNLNASGVYSSIYVGQGHSISISTGRITGALFTNTP